MAGKSSAAESRQGAPIWSAPAVHALAAQCLALACILLLLFLARQQGLSVSQLIAAAMQGAIAAALTWRRLAPWWRAIQFAFPLAIIVATSLQLPPAVFLAAFVLLLVLYWSSFRTQVPFYPSSMATRDAVAHLLPPAAQHVSAPLQFIDIGSGFGGLVLDLAARRPDCVCTGVELAPLPWLVSAGRARMGGSRADFVRGDYHALNFATYDLVFAYLSPAAMTALWRKARAEMRAGSVLLSCEFEIDGVAPDFMMEVGAKQLPLYGWRM